MTSKYVKCDGCGAELGMEKLLPGHIHWSRIPDFVKELNKLGWQGTDRLDSDHYCPTCVAEGKDKKAIVTTTGFIEPGSGTQMLLGKWYVLADSGSAYTAQAFDSPEAAQQWWTDVGREEFSNPGCPEDLKLLVPVYKDGEWDDSDSPQCMKADDLLDFWLRDGSEPVEYARIPA